MGRTTASAGARIQAQPVADLDSQPDPAAITPRNLLGGNTSAEPADVDPALVHTVVESTMTTIVVRARGPADTLGCGGIGFRLVTEPAYVVETRTAYDTVAESYAELLRGALDASPWDRAMLGTFAELVGTTGPVGDLGCGPGRLTGYLASLGLAVFGVDLSPVMVEVARQAHPGLRFDVGSLVALELADGSLAGALAWYSLIHTPPEQLPLVVAELTRVLAPGGRLLAAFQVGDELRHIANGYGHAVSLDAYRLQPDFVAGLFTDAGLVVEARMVREPEPPEHTPQAYLLARKPG
jgi:SAM-dependent methyltransferase